jgi:hypothetical protein
MNTVNLPDLASVTPVSDPAALAAALRYTKTYTVIQKPDPDGLPNYPDGLPNVIPVPVPERPDLLGPVPSINI